jgi:hypothetical protein
MPYNLFRMFRTVLLSSGTPWSGHVECWIWRTVCTLRDCKIKNRKLQAISYGLCSGKPEKSNLEENEYMLQNTESAEFIAT